jgi:hypothetical protein
VQHAYALECQQEHETIYLSIYLYIRIQEDRRTEGKKKSSFISGIHCTKKIKKKMAFTQGYLGITQIRGDAVREKTADERSVAISHRFEESVAEPLEHLLTEAVERTDFYLLRPY